ncbi:uncharacterized protein DS421_12g365380 [Arachis hypogaea]|nr:uncharacterized protein DS421_12g365380 [Arachis hypogaea]
MAEQVMELYAEVGDVGGGGSGHSNFVQDDPPLSRPPLHCASLVEDMDVDGEESDEEYVTNSNDSSSSEDDDEEEEFIPETPVNTSVRYLLPVPQPIPVLSAVCSHYHTSNLDVMHEKNSIFQYGWGDYNIDGGVKFKVGWCAEIVITL